MPDPYNDNNLTVVHGQSAAVNRIPVNAGIIFFLFLSGLSTIAFATGGEHIQRTLFQQAERALEENNDRQFSSLLTKLADYSVVAYLKKDAFLSELSNASPKHVKAFLDEHQDYPFHYHVLSQWLNILAKREDWENYLAFYDDRSDAKYQCLALTARLKTGQTHKINQQIRSLWMTGYSQPDHCDQPFDHFLATEPNVEEAIWQRIEKAFKARRSSLARYLGKKLETDDQAIVDDWDQAHRNPQKWLDRLQRRPDTELNRKIIVHAVDRLARRDSLLARNYWQAAMTQYRFSQQQKNRINKQIALSTAYQHKAEAKQLLEALPQKLKTDNAHLWLARIHLRDEDWIGLVKTIINMPDHLKKEAEWRYWLARAYDEAGQGKKAATLYDQLSRRSTYYGFLAADRAGRSYRIEQQRVTDTSVDEQAMLARNVHLLRARELFFLDRLLEARREWFQGIRKLQSAEIKQAARIASNWKWHENAIKTVAKTGHRNDYDLRFPMPYQQQVMANIQRHDLDPAVIYGIMRRESLFDPLAKSRVGALGLMQLMPSTARLVARSIGLKKPAQADILDIRNNIRLGTQYFKNVLAQFDENVSLAAAAYNAGPNNVRRWLPEEEPMAADLWVETVPYKETRNYIQAVLAYATIFDKHLGQDIQISSRMDEVKATY